jgi:hypothetical protein
VTYRDNGSYLRFPEAVKTLPERSLTATSAKMDELLLDNEQKHRLPVAPVTVESQNVFRSVELDE